MKNSPQQPHRIHPGGLWFAPETVEPKAATPRPIPAREMTLEQFRQHYFPELVGEHQKDECATTATHLQRDAA